MWLFLDKTIQPLGNKWYIVRSAIEAIELLKTNKVERISFSHDLGSDISGHHVANFIEQMALGNKLGRIAWNIHSASPVGRANIQRAMEAAERAWDKQV